MYSLFSISSQSDEAFILSRVLYGDSDCIVKLLCKNNGRVDAFVRGGMRPTRTRQGTISAPSLVSLTFIPGKNGHLARISQFDTASITYGWSADLRAFASASYLAEIIERFMIEGENAQIFFEPVLQTLQEIAAHRHQTSTLRAFELKLLYLCGYLPELSFVVDNPGALCVAYDPQSCHLVSKTREGCVPFSEQTRIIARQLLIGPIGLVVEANPDVLRQIGQIFAHRLQQISSRPLRSMKFFKSLDQKRSI